MIYRPPCETVQLVREAAGSNVYSFPFFFVVPSEIEIPGDEIPPLCQILPPSIDSAEPDSASSAVGTRPVLSVKYAVRAAVEYHEMGGPERAQPTHVEASEQVTFLPYTEIQPPTDTASFPGEFTLSATTSIWKHLLGGHIGTLVIDTREPVPLAYSATYSIPSTHCELRVAAYASPFALNHLQNLTLQIKPSIRMKTTYSAEQLSCIPRHNFLPPNGMLRLHDDVISLDKQEHSQLAWKYDPQNVVSDGPPDYEAAQLAEYRRQSSVGSVSSSGSDTLSLRRLSSSCSAAHGNGVWETSIKVPIKPSRTLLPTFCSGLIMRSYSLLLRIRISGVYARGVDLEIPLQVVYLPPSQCDAATGSEQVGPCMGPTALLAQEQILPPYQGRREEISN
jgi:hypothetical protein